MSSVDGALAQGPPVYQDLRLPRWAKLPGDRPALGARGPMGTSLSQWAATHLHLYQLDHEVKRRWQVPGYVRHCDDLFIFGDRRADLRRWRAQIGNGCGRSAAYG